jgi:ketosteroid isomerase-like protein
MLDRKNRDVRGRRIGKGRPEERKFMTSPDNKQLVADCWKAFSTRDPAQVAAFFDTDAQWLAPPGNATAIALGHTHHMKGRDAIVRFVCEEFGRLFVADVAIAFTSLLADGAHVIVEERMTATLVNGRSYDNDYCFVFTLRGGRIVQVREYVDTARGMKQVFGDAAPGMLVGERADAIRK